MFRNTFNIEHPCLLLCKIICKGLSTDSEYLCEITGKDRRDNIEHVQSKQSKHISITYYMRDHAHLQNIIST